MKNLLFTSLILLFNISIFAQESHKIKYHQPVDFPILLSGNFGELRSNHIHSGIDIKTRGNTGKKIFSVADGYVSRLKVQANGYGKALYITHPDGHTTVYGHLKAYNEELENFIKDIQYKKKSFEVDVQLNQDKFKIKGGEIVAYSGNSGSSSGPHLHFEIRNTKSQRPLNPLQFGFKVQDTISPKIFNLYTYSISLKNNSIEIIQKNKIKPKKLAPKNYYLDTLDVSEVTAFGVETFDFLNNSRNRCSPYSIQLFVDSSLIYYHQVDSFLFSESRYVNAHVDFQEKIKNKNTVHRLFLLPNNKLPIYKQTLNNGVLIFKDTLIHMVQIIITDIEANKSVLNFHVKSNELIKNERINTGFYTDFDKGLKSSLGAYSVNIPANALYNSHYIEVDTLPLKKDEIYNRIRVGTKEIPVQRNISLDLNLKSELINFKDKLGFYTLKKNGEFDYFTSSVKNNVLSAFPKELGIFYVKIDTIKPKIEQIPIRAKKKKINKLEVLAFNVTDNLSGIESYNGIIDGNWALFEFDPKNDRINYFIDKTRLERNKIHKLDLEVKDYMGNISNYSTEFYW